MIFRTLFSRIALTLFILLLMIGLLLVQMIQHSSTMYQQEVSQKLNIDLAQHIVAEQPLMRGGSVNDSIRDELFHDLMVINPSIELYILDREGWVLGYFAPDGKVKRNRIAIEPIQTFIRGDSRLPLKGEDPRDLTGHKTFSAAKITDNNRLQGYLYIVLGGEQYDDIVEMMGNSFTIDSTLLVLAAALSAALIGGLIVFSFQTRRLRLLGDVIQNYADDRTPDNTQSRFPSDVGSKDEIDLLGAQFNAMADKIDLQVDDLKHMESLRREMVANVSHDLRTPLTTMRGYLETLLIRRNEMSDEEEVQYIQTALGHSQHLGKLIEELFELARLDSCESVVYAEPFSMCELIQDVAQKYQLLAEQKSIDLNTQLDPKAPLTYGDIAMMQRVLENLLDNGLRHTPAGGCISISVDVDSGDVIVKVADTGCGISADEVPRIFERFYQRDANRTKSNNAGLGLAIVHRILELHHSAIRVSSELNRGTTFTFQLTARPSI